MPTFAALSGALLPTDRSYDGRDLAPLLFDADDATFDNRTLFHMRGDGTLTAGRRGKYKFL